MSDSEHEVKTAPEVNLTEQPSSDEEKLGLDLPDDVEVYDPNRWFNKRPKIFGIKLLPYSSSYVQLLIVAFACFLLPGMYNALNGLGGSGRVDTEIADKASVTQSCLSIIGLFFGPVLNKIGVSRTLAIGSIGYSVYAASFLCYSHTANSGFVIFGGALLGATCNLLWAAQGTVMTSYPSEKNKGKYIATFWIIFNLGAVLGALIPLARNIHVTKARTVNDGTYAAFIVLMTLGMGVALMLLPTKHVRRSDGSRIIVMKHPTWKSEFAGWKYVVTKSDPYIFFLFPMFFGASFYGTYQFNCVNAAHFSTRTRSLNNLLYWFCQMIGASILGNFLDFGRIRRSLRAKIAICFLMVITMCIWGGGYAFQKNYTRADTKKPDWVVTDWKDPGYIGPMFLYMFYGIYDAMFQTFCYWTIGSLTNNSRKIAIFIGLYKGVQGTAGITAFSIDWKKAEFMVEFGVVWGVLMFALMCASIVVFTKIKDHVEIETDLEFSDETKEEVLMDYKGDK